MKKSVIIGIGNPYRGDDAVGLELTDLLKKNLERIADIEYCRGNVMELLEKWNGRDCVFLIDAVATQQNKVGRIHKFAAHREEIPAIFNQSSTHLLDVVQVIELAKALGRVPEKLILYGIEGKDFQLETGISPDLKNMLHVLANRIEADISALSFDSGKGRVLYA